MAETTDEMENAGAAAGSRGGAGAGLVLYNTLTRRKEPFRPIDPKNVRIYVCGPTVYDDAHIGNARPLIVFDVLYRLLRHLYGEKHVTYVRNVTDVDDKINARAAERGITIRALTDETLSRFEEDVAALGCLPPTHQPRATDHIAGMKGLIERLVAKGFAYVAEDHVLFDVTKDEGYGKLSGRSLDDMRAGARVEVAPYKRGEMDFVLWKPSDPDKGEPAWESPCGIARPGRPGWHIECSAMSSRYLGETFDIHGGGIDLVFPHHENERAQSRCGFGVPQMANYWMHNGFLQVEGRKMSKSEGNFVTIRELLATDRFGGRPWHGATLRLAMLGTQYRQPIDWTVQRLTEADVALKKFVAMTSEDGRSGYGLQIDDGDGFGGMFGTADGDGYGGGQADLESFIDALSDDLNTPDAIRILHAMSSPQDITAALSLVGIDLTAMRLQQAARRRKAMDDASVRDAIHARLEARRQKNFAEADRIRDELLAKGIRLKDGKDPETGEPVTTWEIAS